MKIIKSPSRFDQYVKYLCDNKKTFYVDERLGSKSLLWDKERNFGGIYRKPLKKDERGKTNMWVFAQVKKSFVNYADKNPGYQIYAPVSSCRKDEKRFKGLKVGAAFFATDASHCYWRMSYKLGYISESLYTRLCAPEYKLVRNKALACLSSPTTRRFYENGVLVRSEVISDMRVKELYTNVRNKSYELMRDCMVVADKGFLKYKTDCVYYMPGQRKLVEAVFVANDMLFSTTKCMVISKRQFIERGDVKRF